MYVGSHDDNNNGVLIGAVVVVCVVIIILVITNVIIWLYCFRKRQYTGIQLRFLNLDNFKMLSYRRNFRAKGSSQRFIRATQSNQRYIQLIQPITLLLNITLKNQ